MMDAARESDEIDQLARRLRGEFGTVVPSDEIVCEVQAAYRRFDAAPVRAYVSLLTEKAVRARLDLLIRGRLSGSVPAYDTLPMTASPGDSSRCPRSADRSDDTGGPIEAAESNRLVDPDDARRNRGQSDAYRPLSPAE